MTWRAILMPYHRRLLGVCPRGAGGAARRRAVPPPREPTHCGATRDAAVATPANDIFERVRVYKHAPPVPNSRR